MDNRYSPRSYRDKFDGGRFRFFNVRYKESDLFIGVDKAADTDDVQAFAEVFLKELIVGMETYISTDTDYLNSLSPLFPASPAPEILFRMSEAAAKAGIGPMGAVAGAVAETVGSYIKECFGVREIIVENGGDIYADIVYGLCIPVFAGDSPLSEKIGVEIPEGVSKLGICTSAGTVGHSLSFGKADAVMIICADAALADSYATAFANRICSGEDIAGVMEEIKVTDGIKGALCIADGTFGICGEYPLKIWQ